LKAIFGAVTMNPMNRPAPQQEDLKVFISSRDSKCDECKEDLGPKAWITLAGNKGALCLSCADLDHLVFLGSGDAALTRRARKHSTLSAVVLKWSKARERYERQGLLVEEAALRQAEIDCLADEEARAQRRLREAERGAELDLAYIKQFAERVRQLYPQCPVKTATAIAEHACTKYSGRVGRSAAAKALDGQAVRLAVAAHIRHVETPYDELLMNGWERAEARHEVEDAVQAVLAEWQKNVGS
jgi:hypothetical protein